MRVLVLIGKQKIKIKINKKKVSHDLSIEGFCIYYVAERHLRPPLPVNCPRQTVDLLRACLDPDPTLRPNFTEVLEQLEAIGEIDEDQFPFKTGLSSSWASL